MNSMLGAFQKTMYNRMPESPPDPSPQNVQTPVSPPVPVTGPTLPQPMVQTVFLQAGI